MPMDGSPIRHFIKDVYDDLVTAVDLDQWSWELPCMGYP